jgi:DNA-binding protein HU-beta
MNKQNLIDFVSEKTGLTKIDSNKSIDAVFDGIVSGLKADKEAKFVGFGSFGVQARAARKGRNPRTGVEIEIAASNAVSFKAGKEFKESINDAV